MSKTVAMAPSDWELIDAYRKFGEKEAGFSIPMQKLLREIVIQHIQSDRAFAKQKDASKKGKDQPTPAAEGSLQSDVKSDYWNDNRFDLTV